MYSYRLASIYCVGLLYYPGVAHVHRLDYSALTPRFLPHHFSVSIGTVGCSGNLISDSNARTGSVTVRAYPLIDYRTRATNMFATPPFHPQSKTHAIHMLAFFLQSNNTRIQNSSIEYPTRTLTRPCTA